MLRVIGMLVGVIMAAFGILWALQGFGYVTGSPMTGTATWSIIGPITAVVGIAIAVFAWRRRQP